MMFVRILAPRCCARAVGQRGFRILLLGLFASVALAVLAYNCTLQYTTSRLNGPLQPLVISYRIDTPSCRIPEFSPFDFTVVNLYERRGDPVCPGPPSFLKWASFNVLEVDNEVLERYYRGISASDLKCTFQELYRNQSLPEPDKQVFYSKPQKLVFGEELSTEFMLVKCRYRSSTVLEQYVMVPVLKDEVERRVQTIENKLDSLPKRTTADVAPPTNVIVLGVDSVSYLNAYRHLRQSLAYLRTELDPVELKGYVKVGDNSFPNQNPLISGLSDDETMQYYTEGFFDLLTDQMIWSEYAEFGYRSMFLEESARFGLYNYHTKGFHKAPADYYARPMVMTVDNSPLRYALGEDVFCHAGMTTSEMYLNYVERFAAMMTAKEANFFAYVWLCDIPHNKMNSVGSLDAILLRHLRGLASSGALNNTALVFLSDHGIRFDKIRLTTVGKYEDRMPFAFVAMPRHFCAMHAAACQNLKANSERLATHYDVHATLRHLLHIEASARTTQPVSLASHSRTKRGQSLFTELPINRSCMAASINTMWCTCAPEDEGRAVLPNLIVNVNNEDGGGGGDDEHTPSATAQLARRLGLALEQSLNAILDLEQCYRLSLQRVLEVQRVQGPKPNRYYWVTASYAPGNSIFEATVVAHPNGTLSTLRDISRCNMYWGTTWCMGDHWMEKFCHCKRWYTSLLLLFVGA